MDAFCDASGGLVEFVVDLVHVRNRNPGLQVRECQDALDAQVSRRAGGSNGLR